MDERTQYKTALGLAKRSLDYIAQFGTPPTPHAYEVFYTVCVGQNVPLNEALANIVAEKSKVTSSDIEKLYKKFLDPQPPTDQIDIIGAKMGRELNCLLALLGSAAQSTNNYQSSLEHAERNLNGASDAGQAAEMVQALLSATKTMSQTNSELSKNLETSRAQVEQLEECLMAVREESSRDALTGLVNRKQFDQVLDTALIKAEGNGQPLSLLVIDIDHFKQFNDSHGHVAGDSALRYVASCIKSNIKGNDVAARYGGEEFAVILPNTSIEHAMSLAERIRHLINSRHLVKKVTGENMGRVSVSIGVTQNMPNDTSESFLNRSDMCMYAAKRAGRNQISTEPAETKTPESPQPAQKPAEAAPQQPAPEETPPQEAPAAAATGAA